MTDIERIPTMVLAGSQMDFWYECSDCGEELSDTTTEDGSGWWTEGGSCGAAWWCGEWHGYH